MIKYVFKENPVTLKGKAEADPQVIGEALDDIAKAHDGVVKPSAVVATAKNKRHPLHKHFEWRDEVAAEKYRLEQAREIVRIVRCVENGSNEPPKRVWFSVNDKANGGTAYHRRDDVVNSTRLQLAIMDQAERDLDAFMVRYQDLTEVCAAVRVARDRLSTAKAAVMEDA